LNVQVRARSGRADTAEGDNKAKILTNREEKQRLRKGDGIQWKDVAHAWGSVIMKHARKPELIERYPTASTPKQ